MTERQPWLGPMHHASPWNFAPEVRARYYFREPITIQDFTLGKMEHLPGARLYTVDEYREVARLLEALHVPETVFILAYQFHGTPKWDAMVAGFRAVAKLHRRYLRLRVFISQEYLRRGTYREEIEKLHAAGADAVNFQFSSRTAPSEGEEVAQALPEACAYAVGLGLATSISFGDITAFDIETIVQRIEYFLRLGVGAVIPTDVAGRATPDATHQLFDAIRRRLSRDVPMWYHAHDHVGLATANALAATSAGAWPQAAAGGIADNGFASLEEVVLALEFLHDVRTGIVLDGLPTLTRTVERITGVAVPRYQAVTGKDVFLCEDWLGSMGLMSGRSHLDLRRGPFDPRSVGGRVELAISYATLRDDVVSMKLQRLGLPNDPAAVARARDALRAHLDSVGHYPVAIDDTTVGEICRNVAQKV